MLTWPFFISNTWNSLVNFELKISVLFILVSGIQTEILRYEWNNFKILINSSIIFKIGCEGLFVDNGGVTDKLMRTSTISSSICYFLLTRHIIGCIILPNLRFSFPCLFSCFLGPLRHPTSKGRHIFHGVVWFDREDIYYTPIILLANRHIVDVASLNFAALMV